VPPPAADAVLKVATAPWCELILDGTARGRTPRTLTLAPGAHRVECVNPSSGARLERTVKLAAGETLELRERLDAATRLEAHLSRGDRFAVDDGPPGKGPRPVEPGRRRITLYLGARELEVGYVEVPPGGCQLVDTPALACRKP
jgi:hypothetical protein